MDLAQKPEFLPDSGLTRRATSPSLMGMTAFAPLFDTLAAVPADASSRAIQQAWLWWWDSNPSAAAASRLW